MSSSEAPTPRTRRSFLDFLLGAGVVGWLASVAFPVLQYLKPLNVAGPEGPLRLGPEQSAALAKDGFVIVKAGAARILVFEDNAQQLRSMSAKCTHEGCTVQYSKGEQMIWCACHNGRFDLDGKVVSGPPPRPLALYVVQRDEAGNVTINLGKA